MVRIGFPGGPRLEWYDRNPVQASITYQADNVAPHGSTVRGTYTTPAGKKAWLASVSIALTRSATATTVGKAYGVAYVTGEWAHEIVLWNNTVGTVERSITSQSGLLLTGEIVRISTSDVSTGGTIDYLLNVVLTEFDA